jgi:LacI family transcriptional regulator
MILNIILWVGIMNKKVTMQDLANILKVSKSTISKALNNRDDLSEKLKEQIQSTAKELGYELKSSVNKKEKKSEHTIGIITAERYFGESDYYYAELFKKISNKFCSESITTMLYVLDREEEQQCNIPLMYTQNKIDGIILLGQLNFNYIRMIIELKIPLILLDFYSNNLNIDSIYPNDYYNSYTITNELISFGHRNIVYCGNVKLTSGMQDRFLGYYKALIENNININFNWVIDDRNDEDVEIDIVLPAVIPTAFVCVCDKTARRLINVLKENNILVPRDVSVVAFDNNIHSTIVHPYITTMDVDKESLIEMTIDTMLKKLENINYNIGKKSINGYLVLKESHGNILSLDIT